MTSFFGRMVKREDLDKAEDHISKLSSKAEELLEEVRETVSAVNESHKELIKYIEDKENNGSEE